MDGFSEDKGKLLEWIIARVEANLEELRAGYGAARDAVLSTPHVMKSKREVFGQESAYLANALALNIQEREFELRTLRAMRLLEGPDRAALGCLVGVGDTGGSVDDWYLLLPVCGGIEVPFGEAGAAARIVTPGTPVARCLMGRCVGDEVTLPSHPPRIATVQVLL